MLCSLINHCDIVKISCMAQLVNVIAPIMTANGGGVCRQTIFFPFRDASSLGRGDAIRPLVTSPRYDSKQYTDVPWLDAAAVWNEEKGTLALFLLNRGREALETTLALPGFESLKATGHTVLTHPDLQAVNTLDRPGTVLPQARVCDASMLENGRGTVRLEPLSWNVLTFA